MAACSTELPRAVQGGCRDQGSGLAADINADHNPMAPSWTSVNSTGPVTSTGAPDGLPTLHLESERPARDRGFESPRFRGSAVVRPSRVIVIGLVDNSG